MRKAFTLVELLIVIAIIAILAAIAIPQYTKYVKKSAAASAEATLSNCLTAAMAQFADNGSTEYPCKVPNGKGGSEPVKIKLDPDGNLKGFLSGNTTSSNTTTTITIKIKEHEVNCTAHTDTNTITCE